MAIAYKLSPVVDKENRVRPVCVADLLIELLKGTLVDNSGNALPWPPLESLNVTQMLNARFKLSFRTRGAEGNGWSICLAILFDEYVRHMAAELAGAKAYAHVTELESLFGELKVCEALEPLSCYVAPRHSVGALEGFNLKHHVSSDQEQGQFITSYVGKNGEGVLVTLRNSDFEVLGVATLLEEAGSPRLTGLYVPPARRRQGNGTRLLRAVTSFYRNIEGNGRTLEVSRHNGLHLDLETLAAPVREYYWDAAESWDSFIQAAKVSKTQSQITSRTSF